MTGRTLGDADAELAETLSDLQEARDARDRALLSLNVERNWRHSTARDLHEALAFLSETWPHLRHAGNGLHERVEGFLARHGKRPPVTP